MGQEMIAAIRGPSLPPVAMEESIHHLTSDCFGAFGIGAKMELLTFITYCLTCFAGAGVGANHKGGATLHARGQRMSGARRSQAGGDRDSAYHPFHWESPPVRYAAPLNVLLVPLCPASLALAKGSR